MITNQPARSRRRPRLEIDRQMLWAPGVGDWTYSHHPSICLFDGRLHAFWSSGRRDEDAPGQRVMTASTAVQDLHGWSAPRVLVDTMPGRHSDRVLTHTGSTSDGTSLQAYFGCYEYAPGCLDENGRRPPGDIEHIDTTLFRIESTDGRTWCDPVDLHEPTVPNCGPTATPSGRLIMPSNFLHLYTDDPSGRTGWQRTGLWLDAMLPEVADDSAGLARQRDVVGREVPVCEGMFYALDDGTLVMLYRTGQGMLQVSRSADDGESWSEPTSSDFTDNVAKFHLGRLPDGRTYHVGNPDREPAWQRNPLVISTSDDGEVFDRAWVIADEPYQSMADGLHKGGHYGYPNTLVHEGTMLVIVSRQKEAVEVLWFDLEQLG